MDANTLAEKSKRKKIEGRYNEKNEDKISHLPDSVLHYILSFLPTKNAVSTSILSTKWRYLWTAIHNFEFYDGLQGASKKQIREKERPFSDFVDKVLVANDSSKMQQFSLTCQKIDYRHFQKWMATVARRNVEELIISITKNSPCNFPFDLLNFELLRILKIDMDVGVKIPDLICFANLKVLDLKRITFFGGFFTNEVSINCPIIEELVVHGWRWLRIKKVNIYVPKLHRLNINDEKSCCSQDFVIKIHAESLVSLKLDMFIAYEYSLCSLSSLVDAYIEFNSCHPFRNGAIARRLASLLSGIYNVTDLELPLTSIEALAIPALSSSVRSLSRLKHLRVSHHRYSTTISGRKLVDLLSYMPNIEFLSFPCGLDKFVFKGNGCILGTMPQWFLSGVKLIDMQHFRGTRNQQCFIKFLIDSVRNVDKWTIKFTPVQDQWMIEQLAMLAKDSNCVLEFD